MDQRLNSALAQEEHADALGVQSRGGERGNQYQSGNTQNCVMAPSQEALTAPEKPCRSRWAYQPLSVILNIAQRG